MSDETAAKPQTLTPMGRALLASVEDREEFTGVVAMYPDELQEAIKQALTSIDQQAARIETLESELVIAKGNVEEWKRDSRVKEKQLNAICIERDEARAALAGLPGKGEGE